MSTDAAAKKAEADEKARDEQEESVREEQMKRKQAEDSARAKFDAAVKKASEELSADLAKTKSGDVAEDAWNAIKQEDEPPFRECALDHRMNLQQSVEALRRGGPVSQQRNPIGRFERKAQELLQAEGQAPVSAVAAPKVVVPGAAPKVVTPGTPPAPPVVMNGPLPEDFPSHAALEAAGITTYAQLRRSDLADVPGIGEARAKQIEDALKG